MKLLSIGAMTCALLAVTQAQAQQDTLYGPRGSLEELGVTPASGSKSWGQCVFEPRRSAGR
jgi:hypothetical protein